MGKVESALEKIEGEVCRASEGSGPFLQRDYWAVIENCRLSPTEVAAFVRENFVDFPPSALVTFKHRREGDRALRMGDDLDVRIRMAGKSGVRVVHIDDNSMTICTLKGHPEAGRITFGSYRNDRGDVIFHIRSRARSGSRVSYTGFLTLGDPMQTNTWTDFIDRLANCVGDGVIGAIYSEITPIHEPNGEDEIIDAPTFVAKGD